MELRELNVGPWTLSMAWDLEDVRGSYVTRQIHSLVSRSLDGIGVGQRQQGPSRVVIIIISNTVY